MTPSIEQQNVLDAVILNESQFKPRGYKRDHLMVKAMAGSGKTTLMELIIEHLVKKSGLSVAYAMFTKGTTVEMSQRLKKRGISDTQCEVRTANSFGYQAWRNYMRGKRFTVEDGKTRLIYREQTRSDSNAWTVESMVIKLVRHAKQRGMGITGVDPYLEQTDWLASGANSSIEPDNPIWNEIISHFNYELSEDAKKGWDWIVDNAVKVLLASNAQHDVIDFDDQLYLPLLIGAQFTAYDYVLVDEAQDSNILKRVIYGKMLKISGCLIVVGDQHQAIMGFTGADNDSLKRFKDEFHMLEFPLTTCFRCDKAMISVAQTWVPGIKWREGADEGRHESLKYDEFLRRLLSLDLNHNTAILCRKNAPNLSVCFKMLSLGIGCRIEGKDIGFQLLALIDSLSEGENISFVEMQRRLTEYRAYHIAKAMAKGDEFAADLLRDKCSAVEMLISRSTRNGENIWKMKQFVRGLFTNAEDETTPKDVCVLSSVHKSKGKEWDRVFILGRSQLMPSPFATTAWQMEQEHNLLYVATTRAKHTLVDITHIPE